MQKSAGRTSRVLGFSVPPTVLREVEALAKAERRTKSELFREMVRVYSRFRLQRDRDEQRWIEAVIDEARAEKEAGPADPAALLKESRRLSLLGAKRARGLGLRAGSLDDALHETRRRRHA